MILSLISHYVIKEEVKYEIKYEKKKKFESQRSRAITGD